MESESLAVAADNRVAIRPAGERYLGQLETVMGRKPSTIADYRYMLAGHMIPFFGERKLDRIDADLVGDYMACKRREAWRRRRWQTTCASSMACSASP